MKRMTVAGVVLAMLAGAPAAQAFHPFDDSYGYQMPKKFGRKGAPADVSAPAIANPAVLGKGKQKAFGQATASKKKSGKVAKGPAQMSGGPKPSIAAVAPPTVTFPNGYGSGSIVIDTARRKLFYVLSSTSAYQYPISVGRQGFTWTGTEKISRKVQWPDWRPPAEMLARKPELPEFMEGGIRNPLGARALYLGNSLYRIHGTNDVKSIGTAASSGCFRMMNGHVVHLSNIASVGTTVHVVSKLPSNVANAN
ncbi:MAG: L,D-transpeptidase [Hyphomicrobium sp.]